MDVNRTGCTRIVFIFKTIVIKIPNFTYSWEHFLKGILSNIHEFKTYKYNSGMYNNGLAHLLCPVMWCSFGGWIIVMKRAEILTDEQYLDADLSVHELHFGGDDKSNSYGFLNGYIVKVDYGQ